MSIELHQCTICWSEISPIPSEDKTHVAARLNCTHIFHKTCMKDWYAQSKTCPNCRAKVTGAAIGTLDAEGQFTIKKVLNMLPKALKNLRALIEANGGSVHPLAVSLLVSEDVVYQWASGNTPIPANAARFFNDLVRLDFGNIL